MSPLMRTLSLSPHQAENNLLHWGSNEHRWPWWWNALWTLTSREARGLTLTSTVKRKSCSDQLLESLQEWEDMFFGFFLMVNRLVAVVMWDQNLFLWFYCLLREFLEYNDGRIFVNLLHGEWRPSADVAIHYSSVSLSTTLFPALINYLVECHEVQTFIVSRQCILLTLVSLSLVP